MVMTMFEPVRISPSILSADFMDLASDIATIQRGGADWVHVDVMDGHFVPNLTMGVPLVRQLKRSCTMPLDVHLMISNPLRQIPWFVEAVSGDEGLQAVELARSLGAQVGVAVKPATPVGAVAHLVPLVDMVLVMSVEPGFSGQSYIEGSELKVTEVVDVAREAGCAPVVQVDGGIGPGTLGGVVAAGADCLVCGNAVFAANAPERALADIRARAEEVRASSAAEAAAHA